MPVRNALNSLLAGALVACATCTPIQAQSASFSSKVTTAPARPAEATSGYNQPPKNILDVMRAPAPPIPRVSPTHDTILLVSWQEYPSISRVATPFLRLAGVRVEPRNHSKHDTPGGYGITPCATKLRTGAHRRRRGNSCRASRGRVPGRAHLGRGRKTICVREYRSRVGRTLDRRCQNRRSTPCSARSPPQPDVQRRDVMDARSENAFGQAGAQRDGRAAARTDRARLAPASRRPKDKKDRAVPTKTATRWATSTTRIFSITSRPRNSP